MQPAVQAFFGVDVADLALPQAALLAGLAQSPTEDDPFIDPEAPTARRNEVLARMAEQGFVDQAQAAAAQAAPLGLAPAPAPRRGCAEATVGHFVCDVVQRHLLQELGLTQQQLDNGGYVIQTTLDVDLQRAGDAAVLRTLAMGNPLAGLFTAVEPGTGHLLAMSVNRVFGYDVDDAAQESFNLNLAASKGSGSTYKVFTAAAALARGYSSHYTLTTSDPYVARVYRDGDGRYDVENVGTYRSTLDLTTALYQSRGSGEFPPADEVVMNGNTRPVPGCTSVRGCRAALADAGFEHRTVQVDSARRSGVMLGTSPPSGGRAVPGQVVSILVSNGEDHVAPRPERAPAPAPQPSRQQPEAPVPSAEPPPPAPETVEPAPEPQPEPEPEPGPDQRLGGEPVED